jgi:hypothetical protein
LFLLGALAGVVRNDLHPGWERLAVLAGAVGLLAGGAVLILAYPRSEVRIDRARRSLTIRRGGLDRTAFEASFDDVLETRVDASTDPENEPIYRVTIVARAWRQPLSPHWSSDRARVEQLAARIRAWIAGHAT